MTSTPKGLQAGGRRLWQDVTKKHDGLDGAQLAALEAACRQRDRADTLAPEAANGDPSALRHEREASLAMARLLAAMRLPDEETGRRPRARRIRGVQALGPVPATDRVTSLERARQKAAGG